VYALSLSSGQTLQVGSNAGGQTAITWTAPSGGLTIILDEQQYYGVQNLGQYTDLSVPAAALMHIALPATAGLIVAGFFTYCGFAVKESSGAATASFDLHDAHYANAVDYVTLDGNESAREFYPVSQGPDRSVTGIPIVAASNGGLYLANPVGAYTGVVRIAGR
jgi:hypothetical protein